MSLFLHPPIRNGRTWTYSIYTSCISGMIPLRDWATATESVLKLGLPWRMLRPQLISRTQYGMVNYQQWIRELSITEPKLQVLLFSLSLFPCCFKCWKEQDKLTPWIWNVWISWQVSDTSILDTMYKNHSNLETIFRIIDTDHSGGWAEWISMINCTYGLKSISDP